MAYEPLTFNKFKSQLASDHYGNVSGARRAVGKATSFSAEEKEKAHKLINAKFGEDAKPAKPAKAAKAPKEPKAAKAKPAVEAAAAPKTRGKGRKASGKAQASASAGTSEERGLELAERVINAATASLTALNGVRDEKDTKSAVVRAIADATALLASGIAAARGVVMPSVAQPMNGVTGKAPFEQSIPAD